MDLKKIGRRLLFPHPAVVALICILSAAGLTYSFTALYDAHPVSIVAYGISFYALVLACVRIPQIIARVHRFQKENPYYLRWREDARLRMNLTLYGAMGLNGAYAAFQFCLGLYHHSTWFYAMAGYYLLLAVMRWILARSLRDRAPGEDVRDEWKKCRLCGVLLLLMNIILLIFILYFVFRIRVFVHHEITTIAMAAHTFTSLALAIIHLVRARKSGSPVLAAARAISLAAAAVSVLVLENALLTAYGQENTAFFHQIMLGTSGAAVIFAVQGIALYMIKHAQRNLKHKEG